MKKTIQVLLIIILVIILSFILIFVFNPLELRTKIIGSVINSYLSSSIENYTPIDNLQNDSSKTATDTSNAQTPLNDKHPLLNETQEKTLESFGVNVEQLPTSITPGMKTCFIEKLGEARASEIVKGATPNVIEFFKAKECIGK